MVDATDKYVVPGGIDTCTHFYQGVEGEQVIQQQEKQPDSPCR